MYQGGKRFCSVKEIKISIILILIKSWVVLAFCGLFEKSNITEQIWLPIFHKYTHPDFRKDMADHQEDQNNVSGASDASSSSSSPFPEPGPSNPGQPGDNFDFSHQFTCGVLLYKVFIFILEEEGSSSDVYWIEGISESESDLTSWEDSPPTSPTLPTKRSRETDSSSSDEETEPPQKKVKSEKGQEPIARKSAYPISEHFPR